MSNETRNLGLFPLGLVLLPGERLPLHIFEPRYRELVADCTLEDRPFVIVAAAEDHLSRIGCTAKVDELVERFEDGRLHIIVLGEEAVEVLEETSGASYFTADVRGLSDEPGDDPTLAAATLAEFKALAEQVAGAPTTPDAPAGTPISYAVAGALELPVELKQSLLENRSEPERLELVRAALAELRTQLDRQKVASERAHTNGKVIQS